MRAVDALMHAPGGGVHERPPVDLVPADHPFGCDQFQVFGHLPGGVVVVERPYFGFDESCVVAAVAVVVEVRPEAGPGEPGWYWEVGDAHGAEERRFDRPDAGHSMSGLVGCFEVPFEGVADHACDGPVFDFGAVADAFVQVG